MPTCKVHFFLLFALSCVKCDDVLYHKVGDEAVMNCGGNLASNSDIEWKLNNELIFYINGKSGTKRKGLSHIKDKVSVNGETLKVPRLETKDSGVYLCSQSSKRIHLNVVSVFAVPDPLLLTSKAKLHCEINGGSNAEVKWLRHSNDQIVAKKKVIDLNPVTLNDEGQWTCLVNDDLKISLQLTVVGLRTNAVEVPEGGNAVLPCSLSQSVSQRVVGGKWTAGHLPRVSFPTLTNSESEGLRWSGENSSKVMFTSGQLINYDVTLINAQFSDEGNYVCTVKFEGGAELIANTSLMVTSAKTSGGQEVTNRKGRGKTPTAGVPWTKDVIGLQLWIWIAIGGGVVIVLTIVIVLVLLKNKQKKKRVKRLRSMRQPLTAKDYCKCKRAEIEVELDQQERPLPVPRQQRKPRTRAAGYEYMTEKSKAQDY